MILLFRMKSQKLIRPSFFFPTRGKIQHSIFCSMTLICSHWLMSADSRGWNWFFRTVHQLQTHWGFANISQLWASPQKLLIVSAVDQKTRMVNLEFLFPPALLIFTILFRRDVFNHLPSHMLGGGRHRPLSASYTHCVCACVYVCGCVVSWRGDRLAQDAAKENPYRWWF